MRISDWSSDVCSSDLYVRNFFKGFDSSRVLTAGDVAQLDPEMICRVNGKAPSFKAGTPYGYLIDEQDQLLGVVDTDGNGSVAQDVAGQRHSLHEQRRSEEHTSELQSLLRISYAV